MSKLAFDCSRCEGDGCDRKESCLRHHALKDIGPRTPVTRFMCGWGEQFVDHFIPIEKSDDVTK